MPFPSHKIFEEFEPDKYKTSTQKKVESALESAKKEGLGQRLESQEFESLNLREQYEAQVQALLNSGIIESQSESIEGIDAQEYPLPSYEAVIERFKENETMIKNKIEQGFTRLLMVPIAMSLDKLIDKYKESLLKHHKAKKLFATKLNPSDPDLPLELNEKEPIWVWDKYKNADTKGELIYYPQEFSKNHGGKTKLELIAETKSSSTPGWQVLLIEDLPNIPREKKGKTIGTRPQLEANKTPNEYLKTIQTEATYQNESGLTPEDWLILAATNLEKTNQVTDDYQGNGSISYEIGAYFPSSGGVPSAYWDRDNRRAGLGGDNPSFRDDSVGVRVGVKV